MLDRSSIIELMALAEKSVVCSEAVDLLDRCLAERSSSLLEAFMQRHMLANPASIDVLQDLAESVHQHMIALQQSLFDIRAEMLKSLDDHYHIDLTPLVPLELIEDYNALELDEALAFITSRYPHLVDSDLVIICHTMHNAVSRAGQITQSLLLVRQILDYIFDWSEALGVFVVKAYWHWQNGNPQVHPTLFH
ncbi:MAG: hypothetical protein H0X30_23910 [Anaerolineae bacterium]|nr:hypothetical protein [Anaerolineae bacterium]